MQNGAFALLKQMLHFPYFFQILVISKASKGTIMELRAEAATQRRRKKSFQEL